MKRLKKFLIICLCISLFIPKTYAYQIDSATFDNALGYNIWSEISYNPTSNINNSWVIDGNRKPTFGVRLQAVDTSSVSTGQLILYVNMCYDYRNSVIEQESITNTFGSLVKLQKIGQSTQSLSCSFGSWSGDLIQTSWIMNYNLVRDGSSGNSFLDSTINFHLPNNILGFNSTMRFVNVYIDKYDESIVQSIKQAQIGETTNQELSNINSKIEETNDKLDDVNDNLGNINDNITNNDINGAQNTANGFFDNFSDNDYGLSSIITIPLSSIQKITNATCTPINIPIPFTNKNIPLPCMGTIYQQNVPLLLNIWQVVSFGLISYAIIVDIFGMVKKFKDPNDDKLEVMDL